MLRRRVGDMASAAAAKSIKSLFSGGGPARDQTRHRREAALLALDSARSLSVSAVGALTRAALRRASALALARVAYLEAPSMPRRRRVTVTTILAARRRRRRSGTLAHRHASGWRARTKCGVILCACALFAATAAHRARAARASALLLRTCATVGAAPRA